MKSRGKRSRNASAEQAKEGATLAQSDAHPTPSGVQTAEAPKEDVTPVIPLENLDPPVVQEPPGEEGASSPASIAIDDSDDSAPGTGLAKVEGWEWTRVKRRALELTIEGLPIGQIADKLGKHRNTIRNWWNAPEFQQEVKQRTMEHATSMKLRQVTRSSVLGEALYTKATRLMSEALKPEGKLNIGEAQLILRELRDYQREERELVEGNIQRIEQRVFIDGQVDVNHKKDSASGRNFKEWLAEHTPKITSLHHLPPDATAQEALIEGVAELLQETDLLDSIAEEDKETVRAEAEAAAAMKRKR